jgi:hypothetical protein
MAATGKTKPAPPTPREHFVERWENFEVVEAGNRRL